jgi:tellurite methyltransferase
MDQARWNQRYLEDPDIGPPTPLLQTIAGNLAPGRALDLACGKGRNALWLAQQGWNVTAIDGAPAAIAALNGSPVTAILADLNADEYKIEPSVWDLILIAYYLQRNLFEPAKAGLKPGGILIVIVHTVEPGEESTDRRVKPGELLSYFEGWEILHQYEGQPNDFPHRRRSAELVARRPIPSAR